MSTGDTMDDNELRDLLGGSGFLEGEIVDDPEQASGDVVPFPGASPSSSSTSASTTSAENIRTLPGGDVYRGPAPAPAQLVGASPVAGIVTWLHAHPHAVALSLGSLAYQFAPKDQRWPWVAIGVLSGYVVSGVVAPSLAR